MQFERGVALFRLQIVGQESRQFTAALSHTHTHSHTLKLLEKNPHSVKHLLLHSSLCTCHTSLATFSHDALKVFLLNWRFMMSHLIQLNLGWDNQP